MSGCRTIITLLLVSCVGTFAWGKDEISYYEKDGVTYRETRRSIQRPITETRLQQSTQTVYRQQNTTELRDTVQQRRTQVTEYRWEAFWVNRWNPLAKPYLAYRYVPHTRWEYSTQTVKTPVVCSRLVPETRTTQVPVNSQRMVEEEVISRVAVSGTAVPRQPWTAPASGVMAPATSTARLVPVPDNTSGMIGGVARLENDPPRQGINTAWRSSGSTRR